VLRAVPAVALASTPLAGCITQDLQFVAPESWPPAVEVPTGGARPLDQVVRLRADLLSGGGDAGPLTSLRFDVEVRDPDLDQELAYKVYVDYQRGVNEGAILADFLPPLGVTASNRGRRPFSFSVPTAALREPGCHRVELLVSERFRPASADDTGREPVVAGDLGTATWWVATQATEGESVDMTGCP
jgi:hypothetical protein